MLLGVVLHVRARFRIEATGSTGQAADLSQGQLSIRPGAEVGIANSSDASSNQALNRKAHRLAHPSNLAVSALMNREAKDALGDT